MIRKFPALFECETVCGISGHHAAVKSAGVAGHVMINGVTVGPGNGGSDILP